MSESLFEFAAKEERIAAFGSSATLAIKAGELHSLFRALRAIAANAESWHADEAGKDRALAVIAGWARQPSTVPLGVGNKDARV